jgi:hypothetical protein
MSPRTLVTPWWLLLPLLLVTHAALAQGAVEVSASVSTSEVEVGETFFVELKALVEEGEMPSSPRLRVPDGLRASGPSTSSRVTTYFGGGRSVVKQGIGATWRVAAERPGSFVIPAPTVSIGGREVAASSSLHVRVVPAGAGGGPRGAPSSPSPFATPFGGMFPFNLDDWFGQSQEPSEPAELGPEARALALPREPDPHVFLRLVADVSRAVVGEQVTLSYYVYSRSNYRLGDQRQPALADFLRIPMDKAPRAEDPILTTVGNHRYAVELLERIAIFPVRAGRLTTGTLRAKFQAWRGREEVTRVSNEIEIDVTEPPREGRPAGYRLGDVGSFELAAEVAPRTTRAGGAVSVQVKLSGTGALPPALKIPEQNGVEWLTPEKREEVTSRGGRVGGWRTFGYVVRLHRPGTVDLGAVELAHWDPAAGSYRTARAALGTVEVQAAPGGATARADTADADPFAALGETRRSLGPHAPAREEELGLHLFWALVLTPPLGVVLAGGLARAAASLRRRRAARKRDPMRLARRALVEMRRAADPKAAAAAAERALHHAVEAATGVRSRALLIGELPARLGAAGLEAALAGALAEALERCQHARFEPGAESDTALAAEVRRIVAALARAAPRREAAPARPEAGAP